MSLEQVLNLTTKEHIQELRDKRKQEAIDDNKFLKSMSNHKMRSNAEIFKENEPKFFTCKMYNPCAICHKCQNKASHLYVRCQSCQIPMCIHKHVNRMTMIKRDNFKINVSKEVIEKLRRLNEEANK